jgi:hypothetical protein
MEPQPKHNMTLAQIKQAVAENHKNGNSTFHGLTSGEIADYSRFLMFGENDEAFPDQNEWSMIVD